MVLVHCSCCSRWLASPSGRRLLLRLRCSSSCQEACNGARGTDRAARGGLLALLIEDCRCACDARAPVRRRAMVLVALTVLLAKARQRFRSKTVAAPVMLVLLFGGVQWCS